MAGILVFDDVIKHILLTKTSQTGSKLQLNPISQLKLCKEDDDAAEEEKETEEER